MDRVIDRDHARALVANGSLWPKVRDFLWDFAPQVHESWLVDIPGLSERDGRQGGLASSRVKGYILDVLDVKPCFYGFGQGDWGRLALLDGATLEALVKWLGALVCADALRRVTKGALVRELKAALPGVYPEVFGFTAYFRLKGEETLLSGPDDVVCAGWRVLQAFLKDSPEALLKRLKLKLPKRYADFRPPEPDARPPKINLQLLLKLRFPEAYKLCCS